jgi:ribosomal protein L11 methyltransferase
MAEPDTNPMSKSATTEAPVWQVSLDVPTCLEEPITELLGTLLEQPASAYCPLESDLSVVSAYITDRSHWNAAKGRLLKEQIQCFFPEEAEGLDLKIHCRKIKANDWQESWKRHFKPLEIGERLLIKPSWNKRKPKKNQQLVVLDPGLSFGTGQHATTRFCLEEIERLQITSQSQSLLDIGTGSGILAIAAVKLGFSPVKAFDFDPDSVQVTNENASDNGVLDQIQITKSDLTKLKPSTRQRYDFVCANLTHDILKSCADTIVNRVKPGGCLLLAGILKEQFPAVKKCFQALGFKQIRTQEEKEWKSGSFKAPPVVQGSTT